MIKFINSLDINGKVCLGVALSIFCIMSLTLVEVML